MDRRLALGAFLSALVGALIGAYYAGDHGPGRLDASIYQAIEGSFADHPGLLRFLVSPTQLYLLVPVIMLTVAICLLGHRHLDALLAASGPPLAVAVNTWVLKPLFGRHLDDYLAYPSGHTISLVAALVVLILLARPGVATTVITSISTALLTATTIGMVGLGYHYFIDIVGGALFAIAVVLALRLTIARVSEYSRTRWRRLSPESSSG